MICACLACTVSELHLLLGESSLRGSLLSQTSEYTNQRTLIQVLSISRGRVRTESVAICLPSFLPRLPAF